MQFNYSRLHLAWAAIRPKLGVAPACGRQRYSCKPPYSNRAPKGALLDALFAAKHDDP